MGIKMVDIIYIFVPVSLLGVHLCLASKFNQNNVGSWKPFLEFCEGDKFRRITPTDCERDILFEKWYEAPACICLNGIWKVRSPGCKSTSLKFAVNACFQNRVEPYASFTYIGPFDPTTVQRELGVVLDIPKYYSVPLRDLIRRLNTPTRIPQPSSVYVLNGDLYQRRTSYCLQTRRNKVGIVSKYSRVQGEIVVRARCFGKVVRAAGHNYIASRSNQSECSLFCESSMAQELRKAREHKSVKRKIKKSDMEESASDSFKEDKVSERRLEVLLNRRMVQMSIERTFEDQSIIETAYSLPKLSFALLEKLKGITFKACGGLVPLNFLETGLESLIAATTGQFTVEVFKEADADIIGALLDRCYNHSRRLSFTRDTCSGEILKVRNGSGKFVRVSLPPYYNRSSFHLVLDITWNLMDLVNAYCIRAFRSSYRMYHELEQGMEKLYSTQLRRFWVKPNIPEGFYARLFGPEWSLRARNLEKCVEGAYAREPRLARLRRPVTTPENWKRLHRWTFANGTVRLQPKKERKRKRMDMSRTELKLPASAGNQGLASKQNIGHMPKSKQSGRSLISPKMPTAYPTERVRPAFVSRDGSYPLSSVMEITCGNSPCSHP